MTLNPPVIIVRLWINAACWVKREKVVFDQWNTYGYRKVRGERKARKNEIKRERSETGIGEYLGRNWYQCLYKKCIAYVLKLQRVIWPEEEKTGQSEQSSNKIVANCEARCWQRATF